jgi:hypothetical protein
MVRILRLRSISSRRSGMSGIRMALFVAIVLAVPWGCTPRPQSEIHGVAPRGAYAFSGIVDGERVNGTLSFGDPIVVSGSHGRCVRQREGIQRWGGFFSITCPDFALRVRIDDDGRVQDLGRARLKKTGLREERTTCKTFDTVRGVCVVWNTATVEYDRWVEGSVRVARGES